MVYGVDERMVPQRSAIHRVHKGDTAIRSAEGWTMGPGGLLLLPTCTMSNAPVSTARTSLHRLNVPSMLSLSLIHVWCGA